MMYKIQYRALHSTVHKLPIALCHKHTGLANKQTQGTETHVTLYVYSKWCHWGGGEKAPGALPA